MAYLPAMIHSGAHILGAGRVVVLGALDTRKIRLSSSDPDNNVVARFLRYSNAAKTEVSTDTSNNNPEHFAGILYNDDYYTGDEPIGEFSIGNNKEVKVVTETTGISIVSNRLEPDFDLNVPAYYHRDTGLMAVFNQGQTPLTGYILIPNTNVVGRLISGMHAFPVISFALPAVTVSNDQATGGL